MENTLNKAVEKSMRRRFSQKQIRKCAQESALHVIVNELEYWELDDEARAVLEDAAVRLFVKYYNGRELELLTEPYVTAEVVDLVLERDIEQTFSLVAAIAQFVATFEKFIAKYDTEESQ